MATCPVIIDPTETEELVRAPAVAESWELMVVDAVDAEVLGEVDIAARRVAARDGVSGRASKLGSCYHVKTHDRLDRTSKQMALIAIYMQVTSPIVYNRKIRSVLEICAYGTS